MARSDPLLSVINKMIDRRYHKLFDDPNRCDFAIFADTLMHQAVESLFGLSEEEIQRRTARYLRNEILRCINAMLKKYDR